MQQHPLIGVGQMKNVTNVPRREAFEVAEDDDFTLSWRQRRDRVENHLSCFTGQ